jgi:hypothetical protein
MVQDVKRVSAAPTHLFSNISKNKQKKVGSKWKRYVNYAVRLIISKLVWGKVDSSLIIYILFQIYRLKMQ